MTRKEKVTAQSEPLPQMPASDYCWFGGREDKAMKSGPTRRRGEQAGKGRELAALYVSHTKGGPSLRALGVGIPRRSQAAKSAVPRELPCLVPPGSSARNRRTGGSRGRQGADPMKNSMLLPRDWPATPGEIGSFPVWAGAAKQEL